MRHKVSGALLYAFQLEESGVEVIELTPPAVKTSLSADLPEGGLVALITTDVLIAKTSRQASLKFVQGRPVYSNS